MIFEPDDLPFGFFGESSWASLEVSLELYRPRASRGDGNRALGFTKKVPPEEQRAHDVNRVRVWRSKLTEEQKARRRELDRRRWHSKGRAAQRRARKKATRPAL